MNPEERIAKLEEALMAERELHDAVVRSKDRYIAKLERCLGRRRRRANRIGRRIRNERGITIPFFS